MATLFHASLNAGVAITHTLTDGPALFWTSSAVMWIAVLAAARTWFLRRIDEHPR